MLGVAGSHHALLGTESERRLLGGAGGYRVPWRHCLATREDIGATLGDQRPPYKPPDLPHSYASDLKVPRSHREAMRSEHAHLREDSMGREFYGLLDAGAFVPG